MNCFLPWNLKDMTNISAEKLQKNINQQTSYIELYKNELLKEALRFNVASLLRNVCMNRRSFGNDELSEKATDCLVVFLHALSFQKAAYFTPTDVENPAVPKGCKNLHRLMLENLKATMRYIDYSVLLKHAHGEIDVPGMYSLRRSIYESVFPDDETIDVCEQESINDDFYRIVDQETTKASCFMDFDVRRCTGFASEFCDLFARAPRQDEAFPASEHGVIGASIAYLETPFIKYGNSFYSFVTNYSLPKIKMILAGYALPQVEEESVEQPVEEPAPVEEPVVEEAVETTAEPIVAAVVEPVIDMVPEPESEPVAEETLIQEEPIEAEEAAEEADEPAQEPVVEEPVQEDEPETEEELTETVEPEPAVEEEESYDDEDEEEVVFEDEDEEPAEEPEEPAPAEEEPVEEQQVFDEDEFEEDEPEVTEEASEPVEEEEIPFDDDEEEEPSEPEVETVEETEEVIESLAEDKPVEEIAEEVVEEPVEEEVETTPIEESVEPLPVEDSPAQEPAIEEKPIQEQSEVFEEAEKVEEYDEPKEENPPAEEAVIDLTRVDKKIAELYDEDDFEEIYEEETSPVADESAYYETDEYEYPDEYEEDYSNSTENDRLIKGDEIFENVDDEIEETPMGEALEAEENRQEEAPASEDKYTALVSPDTYGYLDEADPDEFEIDPMLEEQESLEDIQDEDDYAEPEEVVQEEEEDPYAAESLFSFVDDDEVEPQETAEQPEAEPVTEPEPMPEPVVEEEPVAEEPVVEEPVSEPEPEPAETVGFEPTTAPEAEPVAVQEPIAEPEESEPVAEAPVEAEPVTVEPQQEQPVKEETVAEPAPEPIVAPEQTPEPVAEPEPTPVTEPAPEPEPEPTPEPEPEPDTLPLLEHILKFSPSRNNPITQYIQSCQLQQQKELVKVIELARKQWIIDGKDKMFSIPDTEISIAIFSETQDPMVKIQRKENIGAVMYARRKDAWNSLELSFDASGQMVKATYDRITRTSFSEWEWRIVEKLGNRLIERISK